MLEIILTLELYIHILNIYDNYLKYVILYSFNFILIFYYKLDQDSKNFLFNFLTFNVLNKKNDRFNDIFKK